MDISAWGRGYTYNLTCIKMRKQVITVIKNAKILSMDRNFDVVDSEI